MFNRIAAAAVSRPQYESPGRRIAAIDLARGIAVTLMILNHGVKGLLPFEDYPEWGLVPVHMITRFASSLFIMVFGIGLAVAFLPRVNTEHWPRLRLKLLLTGLVIYFWYKVLTVCELVTYEPHQILDALLHRSSPSFVEILGFYAIALLWIPFFLPLWRAMPLWLRLATPAFLAVLSHILLNYFHFWDSEILQALLVEHEDYYTWGQLSRAPLILIGLLIGELIVRGVDEPSWERRLITGLTLLSAALLISFLMISLPDVYEGLKAIAYNEGKHPPELPFMLFSMGGAFGILALALGGGSRLANLLGPLTVIGRDALQAFIFHIAVIFVIFRYLLGYWHNVSYSYALFLTLCVIVGTAMWIKIVSWVRAHS